MIFDLGSTLIEFESRPWPEITVDAQTYGYQRLTERNKRMPAFDHFISRLEEIKDEYRRHAADTLEEWRIDTAFERLLSEFDIENPVEQSRRFVSLFYDIVRREIVLCDGVAETLPALRRRNVVMGIVSNTIFPAEEHDRDLVDFDIMPYVQFRIYSSDFGWRKPKEEIYHEALRRIGLPAEQVLFVGDRYLEDVRGPQGIGMKAILRYREGREYPNPMPNGFPVVNRLDQILERIE